MNEGIYNWNGYNHLNPARGDVPNLQTKVVSFFLGHCSFCQCLPPRAFVPRDAEEHHSATAFKHRSRARTYGDDTPFREWEAWPGHPLQRDFGKFIDFLIYFALIEHLGSFPLKDRWERKLGHLAAGSKKYKFTT